MKTYNIIVVGGGPAGYVAAIRASQLGAAVCLVEEEQLGGTCLNHGCIPTKTLLHNADVLREIRDLRNRGIHLADPSVSIDMPSMLRHKDGVVRKLVSGLTSLVKSYGIDVIQAHAVVEPDFAVEIDGKKIRGEKIIAAGGSEAIRPAIPGCDFPEVLTNREILRLDVVPEKLVVIGGGVVGVEMARVFAALGSEVTILELEGCLLPFFDTESVEVISKELHNENIRIQTGVRVERIEKTADGTDVVDTENRRFAATHVLLATGRKANLSSLEKLDLEQERGFVRVDSKMQSSRPGLYAPGDINGRCMLAHVAYKMAEVAAENAMGASRDVSLRHVPQILYGYPEAASVGVTESTATAAGYAIRVGRFFFAGNGRALASGQGIGFIKLVAEARYGEILGIQAVGPNVSETINEAASLMSAEVTVHELAESIHGHPTFSESLLEAAADALGRSTHNSRKR